MNIKIQVAHQAQVSYPQPGVTEPRKIYASMKYHDTDLPSYPIHALADRDLFQWIIII